MALFSDNLQAPFLGKGLPTYPILRQLCRVDSKQGSVYGAFVQQWDGVSAFRDREPCYVWEPNSITVAPGMYRTRLVGSYSGVLGILPLFVVSLACCPTPTPGFSSAAASSEASVVSSAAPSSAVSSVAPSSVAPSSVAPSSVAPSSSVLSVEPSSSVLSVEPSSASASAISVEPSSAASSLSSAISTACCSNGFPLLLYATITAPGCLCLHGITVPMDWNGLRWSGTVVNCSRTIKVEFVCDNGAAGCAGFLVFVSCGGLTAVTASPTSCTCDPIYFSFSLGSVPNGCAELPAKPCDLPITVEVTD